MNEIWSLNGYYFAVYTDNQELIENVAQEPKCHVMAEYYQNGKRFAVQYKVPRPSKQRIEELIELAVH